MAVIIALGNDKDLGFYRFPAVSRVRRNGSGQLEAPRLEILENMWLQFLHQVSLQQAIVSVRTQLCAVAINPFYIDVESMLFCTVLS